MNVDDRHRAAELRRAEVVEVVIGGGHVAGDEVVPGFTGAERLRQAEGVSHFDLPAGYARVDGMHAAERELVNRGSVREDDRAVELVRIEKRARFGHSHPDR